MKLAIIVMNQQAGPRPSRPSGPQGPLGHRGELMILVMLTLLAISRKHLHSGTASKLASSFQQAEMKAFSFISNLTVAFHPWWQDWKCRLFPDIGGYFLFIRAEIKMPFLVLILLLFHWELGRLAKQPIFLSFACFSFFYNDIDIG